MHEGQCHTWNTLLESRCLRIIDVLLRTSDAHYNNCTNMVNMIGKEEMAEELRSRSLLLTFVEAGLMLLLNILSLLGNLLTCIAVYRNTRLRTTTNIYITTLAAVDLLSASLALPMLTGVLISGRWPFGKALCKIDAFIVTYVTYISPVIMGLTALNRYVKICKTNQQYKRFFSEKKSPVLVVTVCLFICVYLVISRLIGPQEVQFTPGYAVCLNSHLSRLGRVVRFAIMVAFFFTVPLVITLFSYRKVMKKIAEHKRGVTHVNQTRDPSTTRISSREIRISKSLFIVIFAFVLCFTPLWTISILTRLRIVERVPRNLELLCSFCLALSNTVNPFIYAGVNPLFKKEFQRILRCKSRNIIQDISTEPVSRRAHSAFTNERASQSV